MERVLGLKVSTNTIERICLDVGNDLEKASADDWKGVLTGESIVPQVAIVSYDGGRIRTRMPDCGPGVHLSGKGWNETKNAIFVSAASETSLTDPEPNPPKCFFDPVHVAKLTETTKAKEKQGKDEDVKDTKPTPKAKKRKRHHPKHKPKRIHRTLISSMKNSTEFGKEMAKEAKRRRFVEATRKAFIGDGLSCNWSIHQAHFKDYTAIPVGAEAILQIRAASLSDDDRLVRLLSRRAGLGRVRRSASNTALAA